MGSPYRMFSQIPGPPNWPIVGTLLQYSFGPYKVEKYHEALKDLRSRYGNLVRQNFAGQTVIHVFDPEDAQKVYASEGKYPTILPLQPAIKFYREKKSLNIGLGALNGDLWYRLRKYIQLLIMNPQHIRPHLPSVNDVSFEFVDEIRKRRDDKHQVANLRMLITKCIFESIGRILLGSSLNCFNGKAEEMRVENIINQNLTVFKLGSKIKFSSFLHRYLTTPKWRRMFKAEDQVVEYITEIIDKATDEMKRLQSAGKLKDGEFRILSTLHERNDITNDEIFIMILSLLIDGLTTTSPTFACLLYLLSENQDVQQKLLEEVNYLVPKGAPITTDMINQMVYLKACVKEALRLYPSGTEASRVLAKDLILSNYHVPAGTAVDINTFAQLRLKENFSDPDSFKPERWLKDESGKQESSVHPFLLLPFSHGPRMCAGRRFAEQDLYVFTSHLIQNFHLKTSLEEPLEQIYAALLLPEKDPKIQFLERTK